MVLAMRDQEPGLVVGREVGCQRETAVLDRAPGKETGELEAQHRAPYPPHPAKFARLGIGGDIAHPNSGVETSDFRPGSSHNAR